MKTVISNLDLLKEKFSRVEFKSDKNLNNKHSLLKMLETIECLSYILADDRKKNFQEKIYILLNYLMLCNAQADLSSDCKKENAELAEAIFAENKDKTIQIWQDRLPFAHMFNFNGLDDHWLNLEQDIKKTCKELKAAIISIFNKSDIINLPTDLGEIEIDIRSGSADIVIASDIKVSDHHKYLYNIYKVINETKILLSDFDGISYESSLAKQSLILMIQKIIGNNVKALIETGSLVKELDILRNFIPKRNTIAHGRLLRDLIGNQGLIYGQVKEIKQVKNILRKYFKNILENKKLAEDSNHKDSQKNEAIIQSDIKEKADKKPVKESRNIQSDDELLNIETEKNLSLELKQIYENMIPDKRREIFVKLLQQRDIENIKLILEVGIDIDRTIEFKLIEENNGLYKKECIYSFNLNEEVKFNNIASLNIAKKKKQTVKEIVSETKDLIIDSVNRQNSFMFQTFVALNCNVKKNFRMNLFAYACRMPENIEIVKALLTHSPDLNSDSLSFFLFKEPILHTIISYRNYGLVKILLDAGANPNAVDEFGITALEKSIRFKMDDIAELLIEYGANIDNKLPIYGQNNKGQLFAVNACIQSNPEFLIRLFKHALKQGGLSKLYNMINVNAIVTYDKNNNITKILSIIENKVTEKQARLIANLLEICSDVKIENRDLFEAILKNDNIVIEEFFKAKTPKQITEICIYKINPTKQVHNKVKSEGYNIFELAEAFEYPELSLYIKSIYKKSSLEICIDNDIKNKELFKAVSLNDTNFIEEFFKEKTPKQIREICTYKLNPTAQVHNNVKSEGYNIFELAEVFEYPELAIKLKLEYRKAIIADLKNDSVQSRIM